MNEVLHYSLHAKLFHQFCVCSVKFHDRKQLCTVSLWLKKICDETTQLSQIIYSFLITLEKLRFRKTKQSQKPTFEALAPWHNITISLAPVSCNKPTSFSPCLLVTRTFCFWLTETVQFTKPPIKFSQKNCYLGESDLDSSHTDKKVHSFSPSDILFFMQIEIRRDVFIQCQIAKIWMT